MNHVLSVSDEKSECRTIDLDALSAGDQRWIYESSPEIQNALVSMLREIREIVPNDEIWWLSSVSSRDPYLSPLFERCCKVSLIEHRAGESVALLTVLTSDRPLAESLRRWASSLEDGRVSVRLRRPGLLQLFRRLEAILWSVAMMAWELVARYFAREPEAFRERAPHVKVLVETFVSGNIGDGFSFFGDNDHYYPGLERHLSEEQRSEIGIVPVVSSGREFGRIYKTCRKSDSRCLIVDDALELSDYLWTAFVLPLRLLGLSFQVQGRIGQVDLTSSLRSEIRGRLFHPSIVIAHLLLRFFRRASVKGLAPKTILSWSENQVVDKALSYAVLNGGFQAQLVAYKSYPIGTRYLPHLMTTPEERLAGTTPAEITLIGGAFTDSARLYDRELGVRVGPALRFPEKPARSRETVATGELVVLVALPIPPCEVDHMVKLVVGACKALGDPGRGIRIVLKQHPKSDSDRSESEWAACFPSAVSVSLTEEDMDGALDTAEVLISNTSSACLEALVRCVEVAVVCNPDGLVYNPIPDSLAVEHWQVCFDEQQLAEFLGQRSSVQSKRKADFPNRSEVFAPCDRSSVLDLLRMSEPTTSF